MRKKYLMTPGPTPVPAEVLLEMARPIIHHRTPEFSAALMQATRDLQYVFQTQGDVLILASSGTGAMESAVVNCFSATDRVIVARNGKFGDRNLQLATTYGLRPIDLRYEWTEVVPAADIERALAEHPDAKGVFITQSETSSGVLNDVKAVAEVTARHPDCIIVVDSITGIGAVDCKTDAWGLDVVMTGSQKGLMLPPGLAAVAVSEKAWKRAESSTLPKFYFDWTKAKKNLAKETTPFTPAVSLVLGLAESLRMIREEGLENVIARHALLAEAARQGAEAMGLELFAPPEGRGNAVTPVWVPEEVDGKALVKAMASEYGITIAGGQDDYAGRIFRIGHLGYFDRFDILTTLAGLEMCLAKQGYDLELGVAIRAAEQVFMQTAS